MWLDLFCQYFVVGICIYIHKKYLCAVFLEWCWYQRIMASRSKLKRFSLVVWSGEAHGKSFWIIVLIVLEFFWYNSLVKPCGSELFFVRSSLCIWICVHACVCANVPAHKHISVGHTCVSECCIYLHSCMCVNVFMCTCDYVCFCVHDYACIWECAYMSVCIE